MQYMDQNSSMAQCDATNGGRRVLLSANAICADDWNDCYPSSTPKPGYPKGTEVSGVLYLTNDATETYPTIRFGLFTNGTQVGMSQSGPLQVNGQAGYAYTKVPFNFTTQIPIPKVSTLEFRVAVDAKESYFIGGLPPNQSKFTVG